MKDKVYRRGDIEWNVVVEADNKADAIAKAEEYMGWNSMLEVEPYDEKDDNVEEVEE